MTSIRKTEELAARQGLFSEVRRRSQETAPRESRVKEGPWIAVSRQIASGGSELAVRVGEALDWKSYDKEILASIAASTRTDEHLLSRLDEQGVTEFHEYLAPLIVPDDPGQAKYLAEMARILIRIARQGHAVLVGRGAHLILNPTCGLRIRAVGSHDARAMIISQAEGLSIEEARKKVDVNDLSQRKFIRQAFNREIEDPSGYDLVLNPIDLGLDAAVTTVLAAARAKLGL